MSYHSEIRQHQWHDPNSPAGHLPPELIRLVVSHLYDVNLNRSGAVKQGLAVCGLVCRYWASIIRPLLFENIELRSREDAIQLLKFLESPTILKPALTECVRLLAFKQSGRQLPPWMHLCQLAKYYRRGDVRLLIEDAEGDILWHGLPRALPQSIFLHTNILELHRVRFRRGRDLVRFIRSLPEVWSCICKAITFTDTSPVSPVPIPRRRSLESLAKLEFDLTDCSECPFATQLTLAFAVLAARERLRVAVDSWAATVGAILALVPSSWTLRRIGVDTDDNVCWISPKSAELALMLRFDVTVLRHPHTPQLAAARSFAIAIEQEGLLDASCWNAFEDELLEFRPVLPLTVVVGESMPTLNAILDGSILARLRNEGKLRIQEYWYSTRTFKVDDVSVAPASHVVGDSTVTLDPMQRVHLMELRRNDDKDDFLRNVLKHRDSGAEQASLESYGTSDLRIAKLVAGP